MKKFLLIAVCFGIALSLISFYCIANRLFSDNRIEGSGNIITQTMAAPDYNGVKAARAVKVIITDKVMDKISISADDNLMQYVVVKKDGGNLLITMDKTLKNISSRNITVTIPANGKIASLEASSAAQIHSEVLLSANNFDIDASSAAQIDASVETQTCVVEASSAAEIRTTIAATTCVADASSAAKINADITATECNLDASSAARIDAAVKTGKCSTEGSSAAKISVKGSANSCVTSFSSGSRYEAEDFAVDTYDIDVSSGSHARINCTQMLNARASSGASISYTGNCKADISRSSGGSVSNE